MDFNFIPYRLNADISHFRADIEYIGSDNGIDLYKARKGFKMPILGFQVEEANLYFWEGSLITVYIRLAEKADNIGKVNETLTRNILADGRLLETDTGLIYYWQDVSQFLGLIVKEEGNFLLLYNSLNKFNVFNP